MQQVSGLRQNSPGNAPGVSCTAAPFAARFALEVNSGRHTEEEQAAKKRYQC